MVNSHNIPKTYRRFCKKCDKYFTPISKYNFLCKDCLKLSLARSSTKSKISQIKKHNPKLTQKQKLEIKKAKHKLTQVYKNKEIKKEKNKLDKEWAKKVKELHPVCLICKTDKFLHSHHAIPRELIQTRHEPLNGVTLCAKHHKFGIFSAHRNPVWFIHRLKLHQIDTYNYVFNKILTLELTEGAKI